MPRMFAAQTSNMMGMATQSAPPPADTEIAYLPEMIGITTEGEPLPEKFEDLISKFSLIGWNDKSKPPQRDDIDFFVTFLGTTDCLIGLSQREVQEILLTSIKKLSIALGKRALAIFVTDEWGADFDIERCTELAKRFCIKNHPGKAPHIVVTTKYPLEWAKGDDIVCISLNRINGDRLHTILAGIVGAISKGERPPSKRLALRVFYEAAKKWLDDNKESIQAGAEIIGSVIL